MHRGRPELGDKKLPGIVFATQRAMRTARRGGAFRRFWRTVDRASFLSMSRNTPFHGTAVTGRAVATIVGGVVGGLLVAFASAVLGADPIIPTVIGVVVGALVAGGLALDQVRGEREGRAGEPDQRDLQVHGLDDPGHGVEPHQDLHQHRCAAEDEDVEGREGPQHRIGAHAQ